MGNMDSDNQGSDIEDGGQSDDPDNKENDNDLDN